MYTLCHIHIWVVWASRHLPIRAGYWSSPTNERPARSLLPRWVSSCAAACYHGKETGENQVASWNIHRTIYNRNVFSVLTRRESRNWWKLNYPQLSVWYSIKCVIKFLFLGVQLCNYPGICNYKSLRLLISPVLSTEHSSNLVKKNIYKAWDFFLALYFKDKVEIEKTVTTSHNQSNLLDHLCISAASITCNFLLTLVFITCWPWWRCHGYCAGYCSLISRV